MVHYSPARSIPLWLIMQVGLFYHVCRRMTFDQDQIDFCEQIIARLNLSGEGNSHIMAPTNSTSNQDVQNQSRTSVCIFFESLFLELGMSCASLAA